MRSGTRVSAVWAVALVLPFAAAAVPGTASACGTAVYRAIDNSAQLVAKAEQSLSDGNYGVAAARAVRAFPALELVKPGQLPLADRALRIVALASVRSNGGVGPTASQTTDGAERGANLQWSIVALRGLNDKRPNNPSLQTDLGEALAKVPSLHAEAQRSSASWPTRTCSPPPRGTRPSPLSGPRSATAPGAPRL